LVLAAVRLGDITGRYDFSLEEVYYFYTRALEDAAFYTINYLRNFLFFLNFVTVLGLAKRTR
jgi:hypothetical protein